MRSGPPRHALCARPSKHVIPRGPALAGRHWDRASEIEEVRRLRHHSPTIMDAKDELVAYAQIERFAHAFRDRDLPL
jgi:hypothetical protein